MLTALTVVLAVLQLQPAAGQSAQPAVPPITEHVEVVATRIPEQPLDVPVPIEVLSGEELRRRGVVDLASALSLAGGVSIAPGGDNGPAAAVPEFWGLREFDAFLLVVDGIPWGGAFNPSLATLSLQDVERIEILRAPAPVTYGATSFVGVIHVVHRSASAPNSASARVGSFGSAGGALAVSVPFLEGWQSRLGVDIDRQGFRDDRTSFRRAHALWRNVRGTADRRVWFNVDAAWVDQDPASPHLREGRTLSSRTPLDANYNPSGAFFNDRRLTGMFGFDRPLAGAAWTTTASISFADQDILRGFLGEIAGDSAVARGIREKIDQTDLYADSHVTWRLGPDVRLVAGGDFLHGMADAKGATFEYAVPLSGAAANANVPSLLGSSIEDRREFFGGYALAEWTLTPRLRLSGGVRLNATTEERDAGEEPGASQQEDKGEQTNVRPSGSVGVMYTAWQRGGDTLRVYGTYRDAFKPAAIDFGIGDEEGGEEAGLLKPETSHSVEGGAKARMLGGRLAVDAEAFLMDFSNLVVAQSVNGLPALANAGAERFQGLETEATLALPHSLTARGTYSFHDATFRDYVQDFDGVPTQLSGKRLEMSARHLASLGALYAPADGLFGLAELNFVGSRFLNKRNTALAAGYTTIALGGGWRSEAWEARFDIRNLTDERPAVAESELGDAQYYLLPARRFDFGVTRRF
jgi:outer membrane receptor protein involved in Fe transport